MPPAAAAAAAAAALVRGFKTTGASGMSAAVAVGAEKAVAIRGEKPSMALAKAMPKNFGLL